MADLDLDELERLWRDNRNRPGGTIAQEHVLALIERVKRAEATRDKAIEQYGKAFVRATKAEAVIEEALEATTSGNMMTPPWVIEPLATYQNAPESGGSE